MSFGDLVVKFIEERDCKAPEYFIVEYFDWVMSSLELKEEEKPLRWS